MWKLQIATIKGYDRMVFEFKNLELLTNFLDFVAEYTNEPVEYKIWQEEGEEEC